MSLLGVLVSWWFPHASLLQEARIERAFEVIDEKFLRAEVERLASDEMEGRAAGTAGDRKATEAIAERLREFGLKPEFQEFRIPGTTLMTRNVVARIEGGEECVVVGAHHDHLGRAGQESPGRQGSASEKDGVWNGADDNASGTAALLAIARGFHRAELKPRRTVVLVAFGAEEREMAGSKHYVAHPAIPLERTKLMVNLDMLGRGSREKPTTIGGAAGPLEELVRRAGKRAGLELQPQAEASGSSDHAPFARQGVAVLAFHENGPRRHYHEPGDHADTLDYTYLEAMTRAAFVCVVELAER